MIIEDDKLYDPISKWSLFNTNLNYNQAREFEVLDICS